MASAPPEVASTEFFDLYDRLGHDAESLDDATALLQQAKAQRDEFQKELADAQRDLRKTRKFIQEQSRRMQVVSTHWFYGTTLMQPQLWFRGGCQGKIGRAQVKWTKAHDQDLPHLMDAIQHLQTQQLPQIQAQVDEQLQRFEWAANAASEREVMRHRAFQQFPSTLLLQLSQQETSLGQHISTKQREASNLDDVISQLFASQSLYQRALKILDNAQRHYDQYEALKSNPPTIAKPAEALLRAGGGQSNNDNNDNDNNNIKPGGSSRSETLVADGTRIVVVERHPGRGGKHHNNNNNNNNNNGDVKDLFHLNSQGQIIATNFPCPNDCGCLVTWHQTHCCNACRMGGNNNINANNHDRSKHGQRCDRKPIASQQGAAEKLADLRRKQKVYQQKISKEDDACNSSFTQARKEAKQAERTIRQALNHIAISIRETYANVCQSMLHPTESSLLLPPPSPHGGCSCHHTDLRKTNLLQEQEHVTKLLTILSQQYLGTVQQLQAQLRQDSQELQGQFQVLKRRVEGEEGRILADLRSRVVGTSSSSSSSENIPSPTQLYETPTALPSAFAPPMPLVPSAPSEDQILTASLFESSASPSSMEIPIATATPLPIL